MNWYYKLIGGHYHVRVFMNGGKCGDLVFRLDEFKAIRNANTGNAIAFFTEYDAEPVEGYPQDKRL